MHLSSKRGQVQIVSYIRIPLLTTIFIISSTICSSINSRGDSDIDLFGCYRNYNTDASKEASLNFDYKDDEIFKMFFIGAKEYDNADYVHLWIYARAWGVPMESSKGHSHEIIIENGDHPHNPPPGNQQYPGGTVAYTFYSFEKFDDPNYQWQRFQLQKSLFKKSSWNRVYLEDVDPSVVGSYDGWEVNNIQIGIDTTFGPADDLDKSYWYSGDNPPTPNLEDCTGELMIALEFVDKEMDTQYFPAIGQEWDEAFHDNEISWIPIDDSNDHAYWYVYLTSTQWTNTRYVRLFIYGYAWSSDPSSETYLKVDVNGHTYNIYPMRDFGTCYPIGAWSWVQIDRAHLKTTSDPSPNYNLFHFYDSTSHTHTNLGIALFPNKDEDHSCWQYNAGQGTIGACDWVLDQGELGVYLVLYSDALADSWDRTIYTIEMYNDRYNNNIQPYNPPLPKLLGGMTALGDELESHDGWDSYDLAQKDWQSGNIMQGKIYSEIYSNQGDFCDMIILAGHGKPFDAWWYLPQYGTPDDHSYDDKAYFKILDTGYSEAEYYNFDYDHFSGLDFGEDGYSFNTDWLFIFACDVFGTGAKTPDEDSAWQTLLNHGLHAAFGYYDLFSPVYDEEELFMEEFHSRLTGRNGFDLQTIAEAFADVSEGTHATVGAEYNGWAYWIHESCKNDYLWDQSLGPNDPPDMWRDSKFEHKDLNEIKFFHRLED